MAVFPDISIKIGHIQSQSGHVRRAVFSPICDHSFGRILLTECPFDLILLLLAS
jgi:hypothetical protein